MAGGTGGGEECGRSWASAEEFDVWELSVLFWSVEEVCSSSSSSSSSLVNGIEIGIKRLKEEEEKTSNQIKTKRIRFTFLVSLLIVDQFVELFYSNFVRFLVDIFYKKKSKGEKLNHRHF